MKNLSNVIICVAKRDVKSLKNVIQIVDSNLFNVCDTVNEFIGKDGLKYVFLGWKNIEWFKSYIDIWLLESKLIEFRQNNIPFYYVRVGRKNDVEEKFFYDDNFILSKSILVKKILEFGGIKYGNKKFSYERI